MAFDKLGRFFGISNDEDEMYDNEEYTEQLEIKNEEKINITKEIIEIGIGIVFLIIAIAIIFPKRKGKHECRNMYKFNLNQ